MSIYLDHAASTPLYPQALSLLQQSLQEDFANPSAAHKAGTLLHHRIEHCRQFFLHILQGNPYYSFIFTSSATESNNTIIQGLTYHPGCEVVFSSADHASLVAPIMHLKTKGVKVKELTFQKELPRNKEELLKSILSLMTAQTKLLCLSHVNSASGLLCDVINIAPQIKKHFPQVFIHVDATQSFSKLPFKLTYEGRGYVDSLTIASHKMGGPKGVGGFYLLKNQEDHKYVRPLLIGGGQEEGMRASTVNAPFIFTWQMATQLAFDHLNENLENTKILQQQLISELQHYFFHKVLFPFSMVPTSPYITTFILPQIPSDMLMRHLEEKEIFVASSSACSSKIKNMSPTFTQLGIAEDLHKHVLRVSFAHQTTSEEVSLFAKTLHSIYTELVQLFC